MDAVAPCGHDEATAARDAAADPGGHAHAHGHLDAHGIASTTIRLAAPLDWPRYADWVQWLQRTAGDGLLRMKGAVRMAGGDAVALHAVMRLFAAPCALPSLPAELGDGVVVLVTQDLPRSVLDEARRRLAA
jgi:G3E family GTPase